MIDTTADLLWLHGYRLRATGAPRPPDPSTTAEANPDTTPEMVEGWDDLDAVLKLIERSLAVDRPQP